jgi:hypothetical protein
MMDLQKIKNARFEVLKAVNIKIMGFGDVMCCWYIVTNPSGESAAFVFFLKLEAAGYFEMWAVP